MRQVSVQVPRGRAGDILQLAEKYDSVNTTTVDATNGEDALELVTLHVNNTNVEGLLADVDALEDIPTRLVFQPQGILALYPPPEEAPEQVADVTTRSPIEVFLSSWMSIGSWTGYLAYTIAAGIVAWIGVYTNSIIPLVAAILIAPFAGSAMKVALGTARGDGAILAQALARYFAGLLAMIATSAAMSLLLQQENVTTQMEAISTVTSIALLQPLVTGAAGALNLIQSENSSLVPGTAVGALVAASLTPPATMLGMALALGMWDMVDNGIFLLVLQLLAINLTGTAVFRLHGLRPQAGRYNRGEAWYLPVSLALTALALAGMLFWQFSDPLRFERRSLEQAIAGEIGRTVQEVRAVELVQSRVEFIVTTENPEEDTMLASVYVRQDQTVGGATAELEAELRRLIQARVRESYPQVVPLVDVTVLEAPVAPAQ